MQRVKGDVSVLTEGDDVSKERNKREESDGGINDESIWNLRSFVEVIGFPVPV